MRPLSLLKLGLLALPLILTACVSQPIYDWRARVPANFKKNPVNMTDALQYLDYARDGYRSAISEHMTAESGVTRTMIVGSTLLLTAAGLKAPSDALLLGGAAVGTVYGLGSSELPRARVSAYLAGVDALNCAEASVAAVRVTDIASLRTTVVQLDDKLYDLQAAIGALRKVVEAAGGKVDDSAAVIQSAQTTITGATTVITSTNEFLVKTDTAAAELLSQVEKIDKAVSVAVTTATPDLSQVKITAGGLGTSINAIVAKAVANANASKTAPSSPITPQTGSSEQTDYGRAKNAVEQQQDTTNKLMRRVKTLLPPNFDSISTAAMASCGVAAVPAPFVANPDQLDFTAKKAKSSDVNLTGGTKEYVVDTLTVPKGLNVTAPGKDGSVLKVSLDAAVDITAGAYEVRLHDQTPGGNGVLINITVAPAEAPAAAAGAGAGTPAAPKAGAKPAPVKPKSDGQPAAATGAGTETQIVLNASQVKVGAKSFPIASATEQSNDKSIMVGLCGSYQDSDKASVLTALTAMLKDKVKAKLNVEKNAVCP